jgi:ubiquinone/menaquinone biosynthesis C-methylase UbiE
MTLDPSNAEQAEAWNGPKGQSWVEEQQERDASLSPFGKAAMELARPRPGERVVDIGCGCGDTSLALSDAVGFEGHVLGIDLSQPMLARAKERARGRKNLQLVCADAAAFTFERTASLLYSRFGVMFFAQPTEAFTHLRTALRPGGRLAFVCWRPLTDNPWMQVAAQVVNRVLPPDDAPVPEDAPGPFAFADHRRVRGILEAAGFEEVRFASFHASMPLGHGKGLEHAAEEALTHGPAARRLLKATDEQKARALHAMREALAPFASGDEVRLAASAWLVTARAGT